MLSTKIRQDQRPTDLSLTYKVQHLSADGVLSMMTYVVVDVCICLMLPVTSPCCTTHNKCLGSLFPPF